MKKQELKLNKLNWVGIDFDGVICISDPKRNFKMVKPVDNAKEGLKRIRKLGKKIVIYTSRPWHEYIEIEEFMNKFDMPFDKIICGKLLVSVLIDDRAVRFKDWKQALHDALL